MSAIAFPGRALSSAILRRRSETAASTLALRRAAASSFVVIRTSPSGSFLWASKQSLIAALSARK
eukprot:4134338-Alexandrium_andersonii.AAC.1